MDELPRRTPHALKPYLLVFATQQEAQVTLERLQATPVALSPLPDSAILYSYRAGYIAVCGFGMLAAASCTAAWSHLAEEVVNIGIAGALRDDIVSMSVQCIKSVCKHLSLPEDVDTHSSELAQRTFAPLALATETGVNLVSSNYPIYNPRLRRQLAQWGDLIDMEGYGIAWAARSVGKPCQQWKVISDTAEPQQWHLIRQRLPALSQTMADCVEERFASLPKG